MAHRDDKKKKRRRGEDVHPALFMQAAHDRPHEKQKARELRGSAWWRKKKASGICYYCSRKFPPDELTMDHLIPLSRGGSSERFNIVPACKDCNNRKNYLLPAEWDEYLDMIKNHND